MKRTRPVEPPPVGMTRRLADLVLLALLGEVVVLGVRGQDPAPRALAGSLGAGLFLVLALRAEATKRSPGLVGALLALAGASHLVDLRQRFRDARR